jgi:hypothetical protein
MKVRLILANSILKHHIKIQFYYKNKIKQVLRKIKILSKSTLTMIKSKLLSQLDNLINLL